MKRYRSIAKRSFKAKWTIYLFDKISNKLENEISSKDFGEYRITDNKVKIYANGYWQKEESEIINDRKISEIYTLTTTYEEESKQKIKEYEELYISNSFPQIMPKEDFKLLIDKTNCYYCNLTISEIHRLGEEGKLSKKNLRGWTLEIDRLKPNHEYFVKNCVMSCYWCNNAKTDEFSEEEFKIIGKEIGKILKKRFNN